MQNRKTRVVLKGWDIEDSPRTLVTLVMWGSHSYAYINEGKLSIVIIGTMNPNKNIYINIDDKGLVDMIRDKDNKISNIIYNVNESQNTEIKLR